MVKKLNMILAAFFCLIGMVAAQNRQITGSVVDVGGHPLGGATVLINGTSTGVATALDGTYFITAPADAELTASFIGYKDQTVKINGRTDIDFVLEEDTSFLEEVTVVAFGTKRKQDLVGSVSSVKSSIIGNSQASSVSSALEGAVAGLQVFSSTGQPGSDASIVVRGVGSLSASNSALVVVDGVPFNGKLSDLNPADIESITVSKDAVSNSLYGSRAAAGVVMVTTKKGRKDVLTIRVNANWGQVSRAYKDYDLVTDPGEFYRLTWNGIRNTYWASYGDKYTMDQYNQLASDDLLGELGGYNSFIIPSGESLVLTDGSLNPNAKVRYNDPFSKAMFKNSFRQEYVASAAGGTDRTDYYVSLGWLDNASYIIGSSYDRFTMRANVNSQLKKWLKVGMNLSYSQTESNGLQESTSAASNPFGVARSWAPIFPVHAYDAEGNMLYYPDGTPMYDAGTGQTAGTEERPIATNQNVICNLYEDIRNTKRHALSSRAYAEFKFLKDFTFTTNYSYDYIHGASTTYYTPRIGDGQSFGGRGTKSSSTNTTMNFNQILSYEKLFADNHSVAAKIGHEYYLYQGSVLEGQKTNFLDPSNPELVNGGQMQYIESYSLKHNIEGFFAMVDYNYSSKYYFSAAFRRDGTSRFLKKWGNFWSVGAAWRISSEPFLSNARPWLDDLKLRASYGTQGNENILSGYVYGYTPYMDQFSVSWNGAALGYTQAFYGNPDLTWEKQKTLDVGLDFRFIDKIHGSIDWFMRNTDDMLYQRPLAQSGGRPYNWENIGAMRNMGVEFELNFDIIKKRDLQWTLSLVGSHYKNVVTKLPEDSKENGITSGLFNLREGKSRYEYYTYEYAGIDEKGNAQWYMDVTDEDGNVTKEKTTSYNAATKYFLGKSALPDFTGGLNTSFYFKGFDLSIATAFQLGGWGYDSEYLSTMSNTFYVGHHKDLWDTFNPVTGQGKYPIWNANNTSNSYTQSSSAHLVSASYFSIRNITLGYTFPKKWMKKIGLDGIRIYATADNLALWSARQGYDPRVSMSGNNRDFGGYAPLRTISGGINLTF